MDRGLSLSAFENMTIGNIIDFTIVYNNMHSKDKNNIPIRQANQSDWDNFM